MSVVPLETYGRLLATLNADPASDTPEQADLRAVVTRGLELELVAGRLHTVFAGGTAMLDGEGIMPGTEP